MLQLLQRLTHLAGPRAETKALSSVDGWQLIAQQSGWAGGRRQAKQDYIQQLRMMESSPGGCATTCSQLLRGIQVIDCPDSLPYARVMAVLQCMRVVNLALSGAVCCVRRLPGAATFMCCCFTAPPTYCCHWGCQASMAHHYMGFRRMICWVVRYSICSSLTMAPAQCHTCCVPAV